MSKPFWFKFYPDKWIGGTYHLNHTVRSCYLSLLIFQFEHGALPETKVEMMDACGITDQGQWDAIWARLRSKFVPNDKGLKINTFMDEERERALSRYEQITSAGKKGNKKKRSRTGRRTGSRKGDRNNSNSNSNSSSSSKRSDASKPVSIAEQVPPAVRPAVEDWLAYKGKSAYTKPVARKAFVTRIANDVNKHGASALASAIERAISMGYAGYHIDASDSVRQPSDDAWLDELIAQEKLAEEKNHERN